MTEATDNREILSSQSLGALLAIRDHAERIERMIAATGLAFVLLGVVWVVHRVSSE